MLHQPGYLNPLLQVCRGTYSPGSKPDLMLKLCFCVVICLIESDAASGKKCHTTFSADPKKSRDNLVAEKNEIECTCFLYGINAMNSIVFWNFHWAHLKEVVFKILEKVVSKKVQNNY